MKACAVVPGAVLGPTCDGCSHAACVRCMEAPHESKLDGCCHFLVFWLFTLTAADGSRCVLEVDQKADSGAHK